MTEEDAKARETIVEASSVMSEICRLSDSIKIHAYVEVIEKFGDRLVLDKPTWLEFVSMRRAQKYKKLTPRAQERMLESIETGDKISSARRACLEMVLAGGQKLDMTTVDSTGIGFAFDDPEFFKVLDACADTRQRLNEELWPKVNELSKKFQSLTGMSHKDFKFLLDMYHYTGGYPSPETPPRAWTVTSECFRLNSMCTRFEFDMAEKYNGVFGMSVTIRKAAGENPEKDPVVQ